MLRYQTKRAAIEGLVGSENTVLDIGFYGQAKLSDDADYPHRILLDRAKDVYGVDIIPYASEDPMRRSHYFVQSAETFQIGYTFDTISAFDLMEHLPNPGLFLDSCKKHIQPNGRLIITTPNAFHFYNIVEKIMHDEPRVNKDHTCYFNRTTLEQLFQKMGWEISDFGYIQTIGLDNQKNLKRVILRGLYKILSRIAPKFSETLIIVARVK